MTKRPARSRCLKRLRVGDTLIVISRHRRAGRPSSATATSNSTSPDPPKCSNHQNTEMIPAVSERSKNQATRMLSIPTASLRPDNNFHILPKRDQKTQKPLHRQLTEFASQHFLKRRVGEFLAGWRRICHSFMNRS